MRLQLLKSAYGLTAFLLTAMLAIQLEQIAESPDFSAVNSGVDFAATRTTSGDSRFEPVPLISVEPDGQACGTGASSKKKRLRVRQKTVCTENDRQPALNSQEQFPPASPGGMTIPDSLPESYTREHTGHEKLVRYCPEIDYITHLCCDGPIGPLELTSRLVHFKYIDFCQGLGDSLFCPMEWDVCCKLHDTLNLITRPGISCVPSVPV